METNKYIVMSRTKSTGDCSISARPKQHDSETVAKAEAARLAKSDKTKEYTVLKVVATASVDEVKWR